MNIRINIDNESKGIHKFSFVPRKGDIIKLDRKEAEVVKVAINVNYNIIEISCISLDKSI